METKRFGFKMKIFPVSRRNTGNVIVKYGLNW